MDNSLRCIILVLYVWEIICLWKIFDKAGERQWKSLIPFYNIYIKCKIVDKPKRFWGFIALPIMIIIGLIISAISGFISVFNSVENSISGVNNVSFTPDYKNFQMILLLLFIAMILTIVFAILTQVRLGKVFGKSTGFCIGLVFLNFIFAGIIAFDDSKYNLSNLEKESKKGE